MMDFSQKLHTLSIIHIWLGVLIALPIAVVLLRRQLGGMLRRHWALACCCAVLTVFAIKMCIRDRSRSC